jgi:hypothetical protein
MTTKNIALPDWAPDDCPLDVAELIDGEQYLENLKLRGLASGDSKEVRNAVRKLKHELGAERIRGWYDGRMYGLLRGGILGLGLGIALGAFAMWAALQ